MDKPLYLGFAVLELSKLHMYETYYDILQPSFGEKNLHLHYMDTDGFILIVNTKDLINDLKILEVVYEFSSPNKNHELFSNKNKIVIGNFKLETPKSIWIDEFVCLRSKMFSFKCGNDSKINLKGFSKSHPQRIKFEEHHKCLFGGEYRQQCDNFIIRSINHKMYLQQVKKSTLSILDDKRCYIKETESKPWN